MNESLPIQREPSPNSSSQLITAESTRDRKNKVEDNEMQMMGEDVLMSTKAKKNDGQESSSDDEAEFDRRTHLAASGIFTIPKEEHTSCMKSCCRSKYSISTPVHI